MILQTERLILRPFSPQDEYAFIVGIGDRELRRMYGFPKELPRDTAHQIFAQFSGLPTAMSLVHKADGALVGFLLDVPTELPKDMLCALPEGGRTLAFATFSPYQRQGFMREAIRAWMEQHSKAKNAPYLHGGHFLFNEPSQRLLASLGFTPYGQHDLGAATIVDEICMLCEKNWRVT